MMDVVLQKNEGVFCLKSDKTKIAIASCIEVAAKNFDCSKKKLKCIEAPLSFKRVIRL